VPLILCFRICSLRDLELFGKAKAAGAIPCLIRNCEIANGIFEKHIAKHLQELALSSISASNVEDLLTDPPYTCGDIGSWAIGNEGEIFGYLVATYKQLGASYASYVTPLATAKADIRAPHRIKGIGIPGAAYPSPCTAVSGRVGGLLSLHEDRMVETRRIIRASGNEEKLDHREYLLDPHVRFSSNS
jgi:hypothetical protein